MILILLAVGIIGLIGLVELGIVESALALAIEMVAWLLDKLFIPINALVDSLIPGMTGAAATIGEMFDSVMSVMAWVIDATFLPQASINLIVGYFLFVSGVTALMWGIKLMFKWKAALFG